MRTKFISAGIAMLVLLGVSAHGAVIYKEATFNSVPIGAPSFTLTLDKFDHTLGTLTEVSLTLDGVSYCNWFAFDNEECFGGTVTLQVGALLTASTNLPLPTTLTVKPIVSGTGKVKKDSKHDGSGDFKGKDSFKISGGGSDSTSTLLNSPAFLGQYTATSPNETFDVTLANTLFKFKDLGTSGIWGPTSVDPGAFNGKLTVAYTYLLVPVPEAGTALFGACVGLLALSRRSRATRSESAS